MRAVTHLVAVIALAFTSVAFSATEELDRPRSISWHEVHASAQKYVDDESPSDVWPFETVSEYRLLASRRKVFAHYFNPFPLSIENLPAATDYYTNEYLNRDGERQKYSRVGGYLRGRPLPVGPWPNLSWREINLAIEILRAQRIGINGFGADMLQANSGRYWEELLRLYDTAARVAPEFRIIAEPDIAAMPTIPVEDLVNALVKIAQSSAAYRLGDGRMVVAPFYAEGKSGEFWSEVISAMQKRGSPIALFPVLLNFGKYSETFATISYGLSNWGDRDIGSASRDNFPKQAENTRSAEIAVMVPISPQDVRPRSSIFWESNNTALFREEWRRAILSSAEYAHVVTWNDYAESTEIAPSSGTQFVFFDLARYFISWFKMGQAPVVQRDVFYYTHRRQIERVGEVVHPGDIPMVLKGETPVENKIEMLAFLTAPSSIDIEIAGRKYERDVPAGLSTMQVPAQLGRPTFRVVRRGETILEKVSDWVIEEAPDFEDPTYVGGSSNRLFVK